jgi:hypothetical protein
MTVSSIHDRITGWIDDQLEQEDPLGADEWGRHVTMAAMQTSQGDAIVWIILLTLRSPWLGQDALGSMTKLQGNIPPEPAVRMGVKRGVEGLRKAFEIKKREGVPAGNGHGQELPPGLKGMRL